MAFLPVVAAAPLASAPRASVCARPPTSAFLGAPVAVARTARPGAATIRMDVTVVVGDNEPIGRFPLDFLRARVRPLRRGRSGVHEWASWTSVCLGARRTGATVTHASAFQMDADAFKNSVAHTKL